MAELYQEVSDKEIRLDFRLIDGLYATARWGRVLAVVGFTFIGLTLLLAFFMQQYIQVLYANASINSVRVSSFTTGFYALLAFVHFFPSLYLLNFSNKMMQGLKAKDQELINASFRNLRRLFKFMGILLLVTLLFYVVAIAALGSASAYNSLR
ncbi:hypothetical protein [Pontibacter sp. SGAir0037]|uniref:hypothetical protein n=1 Tax=Pontibacter sp. SGAir0037 TaxID=2571030 RepID=UPI0010CD55F9|nr:hypothetical protein [Pontibacter sp. SGAir0037]QCR24170.1 hypothetical protein C1N53_18620 [Pontibacter sp. SGAir0037]